MNKAEFIRAIATEAGLTEKETKEAIDAYIKTIMDAIKKGDKAALPGSKRGKITFEA
ncbi:MAG: HU family DNA-binding protein [Tannerellaceae bacterium]|jgi:nucleoid DNA-binding protein|nr:HU family DNA-binding protein [Tannerellaceae bacterium]